jgi:hypothetical protein
VRGVLKWGSFFGALACGGLAYNEHSLGNDSYDQYEAMVLEEGGTPAEAEFRRLEAIDHDEKAQTFLIAGGARFGAFLVQQIFFGGGDDRGEGDRSERVEVRAAGREVRAGLVLARF